MARKLKYIIKCPCCETVINEDKLQKSIGRNPNMWTGRWTSWATFFDSDNEHLLWACDDCIESGKAIQSDFTKQKYCDYFPHLAYYDKIINCETCQQDFLFSKEEQQYWFENLQFWVQTKCINCKNCRKEKRDKATLNTELSNILKDKSKMSATDFDRVIEIYNLMGKAEKAKEYFTLKRKSKR